MNRLAEETSPYLLQHKDNPVDWRAWSPETLAEAKRANKPILLSVGYAACHWCHVMAHESFEDPDTAAVMNELFVNIKVDREERPDIDAIYQHALALLGEHGGWPLTMFLTPDAQPFWGGTYFPGEQRYGRPAFVEVMRAVHAAWADEPEKIEKNVVALSQGLQQLAQPSPGKEIPANVLAEVGAKLAEHVDTEWGGLGGPPKFPQPYVWEALWRAHLQTGDAKMREAVTVTLDRMCQGGIYDHVGGGFARYATDAHWLVPHFEKMLYDNAQLVDLLTLVWQSTKSPLYEARVRETARWVLREMIAEGGGFAATYDADSEGEEGRFYIWSEDEIDALLGEYASLYKEIYGVTSGGNWAEAPGYNILHRNASPALRDAETEARLAACNDTLYAERARRVWPGWDDKVLADWNGLMIAALAHAGRVFGERDWLAAAERAFGFVTGHMMDEEFRLKHSYRAGTLRHPAGLEDYANMIRAAIALYESTGAPLYIDLARDWVKVLDAHFWDGAAGGWFATADDTTDVIVRAKHANDNAVPSGNGTMIGNLAKLEAITGEAAYGERARAAITAFAGELGRNFLPLMTLLNGAETLREPVQVVIVGERGETATEALRHAVDATCVPSLVLEIVAPGLELPARHPAHGKTQVGGQPTAYVCRGPVCSLPVTEPPALAELL